VKPTACADSSTALASGHSLCAMTKEGSSAALDSGHNLKAMTGASSGVALESSSAPGIKSAHGAGGSAEAYGDGTNSSVRCRCARKHGYASSLPAIRPSLV